jgi:hypothetical protein
MANSRRTVFVGLGLVFILLACGALIFITMALIMLQNSKVSDEAPLTLDIRARIDGVSRLEIQADHLRWYHLQAAAPGRWGPASTYVNGVAWNPIWPDQPDPKNQDCKCFSSSYGGIPPVADYPPVTMVIVQARGNVTVLQQPDWLNEHTLIVEFNDLEPYGDDWYEIKLIVLKSKGSQ